MKGLLQWVWSAPGSSHEELVEARCDGSDNGCWNLRREQRPGTTATRTRTFVTLTLCCGLFSSFMV